MDLVGARTDDQRRELRQIHRQQVLGVHGNTGDAELPEHRVDVVADTRDVSHRETTRNFDRDRLEVQRRAVVEIDWLNVRVAKCLKSLEKLLAVARSADDTELVSSLRQRSTQMQKELALLAGTEHQRRRQRIHGSRGRCDDLERKGLTLDRKMI